MKFKIYDKDGHNPGFRFSLLGFYVRWFSKEKWLRSEINIRTDFWTNVFRRNTIRICDHQFGG